MKKSVLAVLVLGASLAVTGCFDKQETAQKVEAAKDATANAATQVKDAAKEVATDVKNAAIDAKDSAANKMAETKEVDAVIVLGCVVRGDTPHFDYVCSGVTQGITELNLMYDIPFIFGLLTTDTMQQSEDRAGGKYGNKGDEAAVTALKMVNFSA